MNWLLMLSLLFFSANQNNETTMNDTHLKPGIVGQKAPELNVPLWIDGDGNVISPILLADHEEQFKVIYCFQSWCPGCHSRGLPSLKQMVDAFEGNDKVAFFAIQTVFEGAKVNTFDKLSETQEKYNLTIPFGHDVGDETTRNRSSTMFNYRTGGTPWFILVNQEGTVVFNDFHLNTDKTIEYIKDAIDGTK